MMSPLSVNVIYREKQYGLRADRDLVVSTLEASGFGVRTIGVGGEQRWTQGQFDDMRASPYDLNLFLESFYPGLFGLARRQLLIPNQDWFFWSAVPNLRTIDAVVCKTRYAAELFSRLGFRTSYGGFTSSDRRVPRREPKRREFLCLNSNATDRVLDVWLRRPEWPRLTITTFDFVPQVVAPNIRHIRHFLSDDEIVRLQNEHRFHLCVSQAEGFGHKLNEGLSCGAVVITTDAAPMNELIGPDRGLLVKVERSRPHGIGTVFYFDGDDLERTVDRCLRLSTEEIERLAARGRMWFEENDRAFRERFPKALRALA